MGVMREEGVYSSRRLTSWMASGGVRGRNTCNKPQQSHTTRHKPSTQTPATHHNSLTPPDTNHLHNPNKHLQNMPTVSHHPTQTIYTITCNSPQQSHTTRHKPSTQSPATHHNSLTPPDTNHLHNHHKSFTTTTLAMIRAQQHFISLFYDFSCPMKIIKFI